MSVTLTLLADDQGRIIATVDDQALGAPTSLDSLPRIEQDSNPYYYNHYGLGEALFAIMGGDTLLDHLEADESDSYGLLYLVTDARTVALPWEYAAMGNKRFLACDYGLLRLLPDVRRVRPPAEQGLELVALAADPLVDQEGNPRPRRLNSEGELVAIRDRLRDAGRTLRAPHSAHAPPSGSHPSARTGHPAPELPRQPDRRRRRANRDPDAGGQRRRARDGAQRPPAAAGPARRGAPGGHERVPNVAGR